MGQQCPFLTKNANGPGNTSLPTPSFHQDEGGDLSHMFSTGKATPGALYLVLGSPVEKRLGHIAESLMKRLRNDYWIGAHLSYKERLRVLSLIDKTLAEKSQIQWNLPNLLRCALVWWQNHWGLQSDFVLKPPVQTEMEKWQSAWRGDIVRDSVFLWNLPTNQGWKSV